MPEEFKKLADVDKNKDNHIDDGEFFAMLADIDTDGELQALHNELKNESKNAENNLIKSVKQQFVTKLTDGNQKAIGTFLKLLGEDSAHDNQVIKDIKKIVDEKINKIPFFKEFSGLLALHEQAKLEYGLVSLANKTESNISAEYYQLRKGLHEQINKIDKKNIEENVSLQSIQVEIKEQGILALGAMVNNTPFTKHTEKLKNLERDVCEQLSWYFLSDANQEYYKDLQDKQLQLYDPSNNVDREKGNVERKGLYAKLENLRNQLTNSTKQKPSPLISTFLSLPLAINPAGSNVLKSIEKGMDDGIKQVLKKYISVYNQIQSLEESIKQTNELVDKNTMRGILYKYKALAKKYPIILGNINSHNIDYQDLGARKSIEDLFITNPALHFLHTTYARRGTNMIEILNTKENGVEGWKLPNSITKESIIDDKDVDLTEGIKLFIQYHTHPTGYSPQRLQRFINDEIGKSEALSHGNTDDIVQIIESCQSSDYYGEIGPCEKNDLPAPLNVSEQNQEDFEYFVVKPKRENLRGFSSSGTTNEEQQWNDMQQSSITIILKKNKETGKTYFVINTGVVGSGVQGSFKELTSQNVFHSRNYVLGLDRLLTSYGNTEFSGAIHTLQTEYNKIKDRSRIIMLMEGKQTEESAQIILAEVAALQENINFTELQKAYQYLGHGGEIYLKTIKGAFDARKGVVLSPAEQQLAMKLEQMSALCNNAGKTYNTIKEFQAAKISRSTSGEEIIAKGIPFIVSICTAVGAIMALPVTGGLSGLILVSAVGSAGGMLGNEIGHLVSTAVGKMVYGKGYTNYTSLSASLLGGYSYELEELVKEYGIQYVTSFVMTFATLGLARGTITQLMKQSGKQGILGDGARSLVEKFRANQQLFTNSGHQKFLQQYMREVTEEVGEEITAEGAKKINGALGFVAEILINSKIPPRFMIGRSEATISHSSNKSGKGTSTTIISDDATLFRDGESHYTQLGYSKKGSNVFTKTLTLKNGESMTHTVELIQSQDPFLVRELKASGLSIEKDTNTGKYTYDDGKVYGNALERNIKTIKEKANEKGMIVTRLDGGNLSLRKGNDAFILHNSGPLLSEKKQKIMDKIDYSEGAISYFSARKHTFSSDQTVTFTNYMNIEKTVPRQYCLFVNEIGVSVILIQMTDGDSWSESEIMPIKKAITNHLSEKNITNDTTIPLLRQFGKNTTIEEPSTFNQLEKQVYAHFHQNVPIGRKQVLHLLTHDRKEKSIDEKKILLLKFGFSEFQFNSFFAPFLGSQTHTETSSQVNNPDTQQTAPGKNNNSDTQVTASSKHEVRDYNHEYNTARDKAKNSLSQLGVLGKAFSYLKENGRQHTTLEIFFNDAFTNLVSPSISHTNDYQDPNYRHEKNPKHTEIAELSLAILGKLGSQNFNGKTEELSEVLTEFCKGYYQHIGETIPIDDIILHLKELYHEIIPLQVYSEPPSLDQMAEDLDNTERFLTKNKAEQIRKNMHDDAGRTNTALAMIESVTGKVKGAYESYRDRIGAIVKKVHNTANHELEVDTTTGETQYIYDDGQIRIPNRTFGGIKKKLTVLKNDLAELKKTDGTPLFTELEISTIAKELMRSGVCGKQHITKVIETISDLDYIAEDFFSQVGFAKTLDEFMEAIPWKTSSSKEFDIMKLAINNGGYMRYYLKKTSSGIQFYVKNGDNGKDFLLEDATWSFIDASDLKHNDAVNAKKIISALMVKYNWLSMKDTYKDEWGIADAESVDTIKSMNIMHQVQNLIKKGQEKYFNEMETDKRLEIKKKLHKDIVKLTNISSFRIPRNVSSFRIPRNVLQQYIFPGKGEKLDGEKIIGFEYNRAIMHDTSLYSDVFSVLREKNNQDFFLCTDLFDFTVLTTIYIDSRPIVDTYLKEKISMGNRIIESKMDKKKYDSTTISSYIDEIFLKAELPFHFAKRTITPISDRSINEIAEEELQGIHPKAAKLDNTPNKFSLPGSITIYYLPVDDDNFFCDEGAKVSGGEETLYFFPKDKAQWTYQIDASSSSIFIYRK